MSKLIVYSGGLDSTVLLYHCKAEITCAVSFDYGSKHGEAEFQCARYHADRLGITLIRIPLSFMEEHFESALLKSGAAIPDGHYTDPIMRETVVPFRNGIMLSIACGLAESRHLTSVMLANHAGDHPIYPDCRSDFIEAMRAAMHCGTYARIVLESPFVHHTKRDIALLGQKHGVDFSQTWSCYKGGSMHCGVCGTCVERREALAGFDPTIYQAS